MGERVYELFMVWRQKIGASARWVAFLDLLSVLAGLFFSYCIRLDLSRMGHWAGQFTVMALVLSSCVLIMFWLGGVYRVYWPFASLEEVVHLGRCYVYGYLIFLTLYFFVPVLKSLSRTILALSFMLGWFIILFLRLSWRLSPRAGLDEKQERRLIIGAGEGGNLLVRDLGRRGLGAGVVGFLDDDIQKVGKYVAGKKVLGQLKDAPEVIRRYGVTSAVIAIPSMQRHTVAAMARELAANGLKVSLLPDLTSVDAPVELGQLKELRLDDLLAREPITVDLSRIETLIAGKTLLITGAGGSIGSEIVRQLLKYRPSTMVLLGHGEHSIYTLLEELRSLPAEQVGSVRFVTVIADVADRETMERVIDQWRPEVIFHAAAHKHVPLMEDNPHEAVRVNDLGTYTVGDLAGRYGVRRMVLVSTDKAVNPTSVMGATKRVAELTVTDLQKEYPDTQYLAVRFGNVLGSRGSVIPKFERQIAAGGPVTVTHPDMIRYFMLIPEAASLVVQTAAMGRGGNIYVLDMGEPVKIVDLARTMICLHGLQPEKDVAIRFTGCRPGEKLFEELFYDPAHVDPTDHPKIFAAKISESETSLSQAKARVERLLSASDTRRALIQEVPEYAGHGYEG